MNAISNLVARAGTWLVLPSLLVGLVAGGTGTWALSDSDTEPAVEAAASSGLWTGTIQQTFSRSSNLVGAGYSAHGDFWFRVDDEGQVDGHAVVSYVPTFDPTGINDAISYLRSAGLGALGLIPYVGPLLSGPAGEALLGQIVNVSGQYQDPMPTREGPITGSLRNGELSIDWADDQPLDMPITIYLGKAGASEELATESLTAGSPWPGNAQVTDQAGVSQAVTTNQDNSTEEGVRTATSTAWSAHA